MKIDLYKLEKEAEDALKLRELELEELSKLLLLNFIANNRKDIKRLQRRGKRLYEDKKYFPNGKREWFKLPNSLKVRSSWKTT